MAFVKYSEIADVKFDETQYLQTGIEKLDRCIVGLGKGQLVIIAGTRAGGKTTLTGNIVTNFIDKGYSGLLCSFEMTNSRLRNWQNLIALGKDNLMPQTTRTGKTYYVPKTTFLNDKVTAWFDGKLEVYDNSTFNINAVSKDIIGRLEANPEIKFVVLDNLMKLDTDSMNENKWEAQSRLVKRLQVFAQKRGICIILVCHPNKIKVLPRIEDIGGSGDIINTADTVLLVHRVTTDFKIRAKEYFGWEDNHPCFEYDNIIEIAKDREFGDDDSMLGVYFEPTAKRYLNYKGENKKFGWAGTNKQSTIDDLQPIVDENELEEMPF